MPFPKIYMHALFFKICLFVCLFLNSIATWIWCFLESLVNACMYCMSLVFCFSLPIVPFSLSFSLSLSLSCVSFTSTAENGGCIWTGMPISTHAGMNVVCIDAVYKCCIKKKKNFSSLKGTSTYHSADVIYQQIKRCFFFLSLPPRSLPSFLPPTEARAPAKVSWTK